MKSRTSRAVPPGLWTVLVFTGLLLVLLCSPSKAHDQDTAAPVPVAVSVAISDDVPAPVGPNVSDDHQHARAHLKKAITKKASTKKHSTAHSKKVRTNKQHQGKPRPYKAQVKKPDRVSPGAGQRTPAAGQPSSAQWEALRRCESGGRYSANTGNGHYGAYQFDLRTWYSVGGRGLPSNADPGEQDGRAIQLYRGRGWQPWTCARRTGLTER